MTTNSKFDKWWNSGGPYNLDPYLSETDDKILGEYCWNACKQEIIKELKVNLRNFSSYPEEGDGYDFNIIDESVIDKIEKEF